jgi:hypothetical protein
LDRLKDALVGSAKQTVVPAHAAQHDSIVQCRWRPIVDFSVRS